MADTSDRPKEEFEETTKEKRLINRRSYLNMGAAAVAAVAGGGAWSRSVRAGTTLEEIQFDRVLHAVDDLGLDPSGGELCDSAVEQALSDPGTLIEFPDGSFRFQDMWALNLERAGITNVDGDDPEFVTDHIDKVKENIGILMKGADLVFQGITMNYLDRNDDGGPKIMILAESGDLYVDSVDFRGYFYRNAFTVEVQDSNGTGLMENLSIKDGQRSGRLGSGILVNQTGHRGEIIIRDSDIWHTCSGAIYASPNKRSGDTGPVLIENCHFKNNNTASVRVGGTDDVVRNCRFEQNRDTQGGNVTWKEALPTYIHGHRVPRHIQFRNEGVSTDTVRIEDCDFVHEPQGDITLDAPVRARGDFSGDVAFKNCQVRHEHGDTPAFKFEPSSGSAVFDRVTIVGSGAENAEGAVFISGRDGSVVRNSCLSLSGSSQDGVCFYNSSGVSVIDSNINVGNDAVVFDSSSGTTENITYSDSCSFDEGGSYDDGSSDDGSSDDGSTDDGSTVELSQTLTVRGTGQDVEYTIETTDGIVAGGDDNTVTDPAKKVSGTAAGDGEDWFWWDSDIVSVSLSGDAEFYINGEQVDPDSVGLPHAIVVDGNHAESSYEFSVSGDVQKSSALGELEEDDTISEGTVSGTVADDVDGYRFSGHLTELNIRGDASVTFQ